MRLDEWRLKGFLDAIAECGSRDAFPRQVLAACRALIPCDVVSYNEVDQRRGSVLAVLSPEAAVAPGRLEVFRRLAHENPIIRHFGATGEPGARRISDFLDRRSFHRLGIYNDFYRLEGIEYQLALNLSVEAGTVIGIAFNRGSRDFAEDERLLLDLVRPHVLWAHEDARARALARQARCGQRPEEAPRDRDTLVVALDGARRLRRATVSARRLLTTYLGAPALRARRLPEPVDGWVRQYLAAHPGPPPSPSSLALRGPDAVLRVWCAVEDQGPQAGCMLVMREQRTAAPQPAAALTARETEVLGLLAEGLSTREAADRLAISRRTVDKHLEHIYEKLGVRTRIAAVLAFAPRLGEHGG